jgi:chitin synthase
MYIDVILRRYIALQNDKQGQGPLASYFKGEVLHGRDTDIFTSNMCKFLQKPVRADINKF